MTRFLKFRRHKNQIAKKPVPSGRMGIFPKTLLDGQSSFFTIYHHLHHYLEAVLSAAGFVEKL